MQTTPRQSCLAAMLDVRSYVMAARAGMGRADAGGALTMMLAFGAIALILIPIWLTFDLGSTWDFTTSLRNVAEPVVYDVTNQVEGFLNLSVAAFLTGFIFTGFTLLPSLFELAFPTVAHPLLNAVLLASIVFDFVTDWGKSWELTSGWSANWFIQGVYTVFVCAFVSVFVQAILVCCVTVIVFGVVRLVSGGAKQAQAVIINQ